MTNDYKMTDNIKDWYMDLFPDDEMAADIPSNLSFSDFLDKLGNEDAYTILNADDSIIRERVFLKVAEMTGMDYEELWDKHGKGLRH